MAVLPPSSVPNGNVPPGVNPFNVKISSLCSLKKKIFKLLFKKF